MMNYELNHGHAPLSSALASLLRILKIWAANFCCLLHAWNDADVSATSEVLPIDINCRLTKENNRHKPHAGFMGAHVEQAYNNCMATHGVASFSIFLLR